MASISKVSLLSGASQFVSNLESGQVIVLSNTSSEDDFITIRLNIHDRGGEDIDAELGEGVMLRPGQVISIGSIYGKISAIADGDVDLAINIF